MRNLRRPAVTLPTLIQKGSRTSEEHTRLREVDAKATLNFPDHWTEPDVRGALLAMHGRVCAYCQCGLPRNDPGAVEHFRPKSIYWWLAYSFDNYLLSCRVCNCECKLDRFPRPEDATPWEYAHRDRIQEERFLLLDPVNDQVEDWIRAEFQDDLYWIVPAKDLAAGSDPHLRARTTIAFFRLNEDPRLIEERLAAVHRAVQAVISGELAKLDQVQRLASRFHPHGIAVRQILEEGAREWLPSPEEELLIFVQDLLRDLNRADRVLSRFPSSRPAQRLREMTMWALATLWKFPPAGSPILVEALLHERGRRDEVSPYFDQI